MAITTRETTATGVTNKGAPLTNAEVDTNFIELQQNKVNTTDLNESIDDRVNALLQAGLGIDLDYDDVSGELTIDSNHVEVNCTNNSGASIAIGTPVYQTGVSGNNITIAPADADDAAKMPAIGMTTSAIANGASGTVVILGVVNGLDTSSFSAGDTVYVGTTAGSLTTTAPTGESGLIQNFGRVLKVNASSGSIAVMGAGRANAVPNLNDGNVFIGNASNQAEARALTGDDISGGTITSFASTGIDDNATSTAITISSGGNVGIGVSDPDAKLEVISGIVDSEVLNLRGFNADRGLNVSISNEGGVTDALVDFNNELSNGRLSFSLGGSEKMRVHSNGNVGIGETSPDGLLHLKSTAPDLILEDSDTGSAIGSSNRVRFRNSSGTFSAQIGNDPSIDSGANFTLGTLVNYPVGIMTNGSTKMIVDGNGNVGINESGTLRGKLHIDGGTTDIPFYFDSNTQAYPASGFGGALTYNHTAGSARVNFWNTWTGATGSQGGFDFRRLTGASSSDSLMTINGNGKVGINQAGPQYELDVTGDIRATGDIRTTEIRPTSNTGGINIFGGDNTTGAANVELYGASHATQAGNAFYDAEKHTFRDTSFATSLQIYSDQNVRAFNNFQAKSLTIGNNLRKNIVASSSGVSTTAGATQYIKIGTIRCGISIIDIVNFGNSGYNGARLEFAMDFNTASGNDHPSVHLKRMFASDAFGELDAVYAEWDSNDSANIWIKVTTPSAAGQTYYFSIENLGVDSDPVDIDETIQSTSPNLTALVPDMEQSSTSTSVFNGNVGIGSSPVSTLSVAKADRVSGPTISTSNTINDSSWAFGDIVGRLDFRSEELSTTEKVRGRIESRYTNSGGATYPAYSGLSFQVAAVNTLSEAMLIDGYGNVGIGDSSPSVSSYKTLSIKSTDTQVGGALRLEESQGNGATLLNFDNALYMSGDDVTLICTGNPDVGGSLKPAYRIDRSVSSGIQRWYQVDNGTIEHMRLDNSGHLIVPAGVTLGTAAGSYAAVNTLDDYEEGTWTPVLRTSNSDGSYSITTVGEARYTKIGRAVYYSFYLIGLTESTQGTGTMRIQGLPYSALSSHYAGGCATFGTSLTSGYGSRHIVQAGSSSLRLINENTGSDLTASLFSTQTSMIVSGMYFTST